MKYTKSYFRHFIYVQTLSSLFLQKQRTKSLIKTHKDQMHKHHVMPPFSFTLILDKGYNLLVDVVVAAVVFVVFLLLQIL